MMVAEQSPPCILFVGSLKANREAIARAFERFGFEVATACCYREALSFISQRTVDFVFCEQHLGDAAWFDLLSRFADMTEAPELVVILDGNDLASSGEAINLGAHDVLLTPISAEALEQVAFSGYRRIHQHV